MALPLSPEWTGADAVRRRFRRELVFLSSCSDKKEYSESPRGRVSVSAQPEMLRNAVGTELPQLVCVRFASFPDRAESRSCTIHRENNDRLGFPTTIPRSRSKVHSCLSRLRTCYLFFLLARNVRPPSQGASTVLDGKGILRSYLKSEA